MKLPKSNKFIDQKYIPGPSLFKRKKAKIKLSANESALGPSPKAIKEYNAVSKNFKRYPDTNGTSLREVIANKFKIDKNRVILGSGSDQIFELVCNAFIKKNDEVIVPEYSFIIYRIYSKINGAKIIYAKEKNFTISVESILSKVTRKTKIVFLANPNNPTGTYISRKKITYLRKKLRSDILLVVDDAYFEFINSDNFCPGLDLFKDAANVLVTRTFSKIYGLAGLRLGWGYSSKEIIDSMYQIKPPFNVNRAALAAGAEAIKDIQWTKKAIDHNALWAKKIFSVLKEHNVKTNEPAVNFFLMNFDEAKINSDQVFEKLAADKLIVRKMTQYKISNSLRLTIGNKEANENFIKSMGGIFK